MSERGSCWEGYVQKGMKKKGDRMVPNCVPKGMKSGGLKKWFQRKMGRYWSPEEGWKISSLWKKICKWIKRKYPKCVPLAKATRDDKFERASAVAEKKK